MEKQRKTYIKTSIGAYMCGYGMLTSNKLDAKIYESFASVLTDILGFGRDFNIGKMTFEPKED
jgi:hypothetical protein